MNPKQLEEFKEQLVRLGIDWGIANGYVYFPCPFSDHGGERGNVMIAIDTGSGGCNKCDRKVSSKEVVAFLEKRRSVDVAARAKSNKVAEIKITSLKLKLLRVGDILAMEFPDDEWLVDGLLAIPSVNALSGMPGHGKTLITIHIAHCVANGLPVFGKFASMKAKVLIISEEDYLRHLKKRFESLGIAENDDITYLSRCGVKIDDPKYVDEIIEIVREQGIKLVIIDSLVRVHGQDENDAPGMARVSEQLRRIGDEGVAVLLLHHHRKQDGNQKGNTGLSLRGSSEIQAAVENHFALARKDDEDILVISQPKARNSEALKPFEVKILKHKTFDEKKGREISVIVGFEYAGEQAGRTSKKDTARLAVVDLLKDDVVRNNQAIQEALVGKDMGEKAIEAGIKAAEKSGEIERVPKKDIPPKSRGKFYRIKRSETPELPPL